MGNYSPDKEEYDQLARNFFEERDYWTWVLDKKGRYPDLIILNHAGEDFGVVEVKTPNETSAWVTQAYQRRDYNLGGISRKEVRERLQSVVEPREPGIAHLVGVTISNQLYCYCWDLVEKPHLYKALLPKEWGSHVPVLVENIAAYLVTPTAWEPIVQRVLNYLKSEGYLMSLTLDKSAELAVARIVYPNAPPVDLAH